MRRGNPHHSGRCRVRGYAEGAKNLMGGAERSGSAPATERRRGERPLGVRRTLKEHASPWEDAEAVATQPGTASSEDPEDRPATAKVERGASNQ
jgi:hypothetical protein